VEGGLLAVGGLALEGTLRVAATGGGSGRVSVRGRAMLGGALELSGRAPAPGTSWTILVAGGAALSFGVLASSYWRGRAKDVRDRLAKATADLTAAQSSLAALDGRPKTPAAARERSVVSAAVERLQSEVRYRQQDVTKMQMHAEMNKVPAAWIQ